MRIADAHCHLQDDRIYNNVANLIKDATDIGVTKFMCCGTCEKDWQRVKEIADSNPQVYCSFGVHPWYVNDISDNWFGDLTKIVDETGGSIGEIGLDHAIKDRNDERQEDVFVRQLELACERSLPISIHARQAWGRIPPILEKYVGFGYKPGFVIHSYSGSEDLIEKMASLGCYFSFSGTVTRSGNKRGRKSLTKVPVDRLLIESDAPDLIPVLPKELRETEKTNKPAYISYTLRSFAELLEKTEKEIAIITLRNFENIFGN